MRDENQQADETGKSLLRVPLDEYGKERYRDHFLEQYKLFVSSAIKVTEWRQAANNWFMAVNTFLVTLYGLAATVQGTQPWRYTVTVAGIAVAVTWFSLIITYKRLNTAKFKVIHELESDLPAAVFDREWYHLQRDKYAKLTLVEIWIPIVFVVLYLVLAGFALFSEPSSSATKIQIETVEFVDRQ